MANEKKYYPIAYYAEDSFEGFMLLTKEEAEIIHKATNISNWCFTEPHWRQYDWSPSCGTMEIDIVHPISVEEWEVIKKENNHGTLCCGKRNH